MRARLSLQRLPLRIATTSRSSTSARFRWPRATANRASIGSIGGSSESRRADARPDARIAPTLSGRRICDPPSAARNAIRTRNERPPSMNPAADLADLKHRLRTINDLHGACAALSWDQQTYMPPGGAAARGRQLALLSGLEHERMTDPAIGRLLDALTPWAETQDTDSDAAALIRVTRREYDRASRVPNAFVQRLSEHT